MARFRICFSALLLILLVVGVGFSADLTTSLKPGKADLKSAGALTFGGDGVLFVGDSMGGAIYALDTQDRTAPKAAVAVDIKGVAEKIAAVLGTMPDQILLNDLATNPISKNVYISVTRGRGTAGQAVIVRIDAAGKIEPLSLDNIKFSRVMLPNANASPNQNQRLDTITDLAFVDNQIYVAGLSNEEFSSNLRAIPFPFAEAGKGANIEIWHGSHGRFETNSPVRTFVPYKIKNETNILAAYTCTPLVKLPVSQLQSGAKVKGTTIAELGAGNRPLDMIVYNKGGRPYILMANNSRGVMKLSAENLDTYKPITAPSDIAGVPYQTIAGLGGVEQLDSFDDGHAVILSKIGGATELKTIALP